MLDFRQFEAADPFGLTWNVKFLWQQNAISIRHADAVDCKFVATGGDAKDEKVIAMPHPLLHALSGKLGRALNDSWCSKLAASASVKLSNGCRNRKSQARSFTLIFRCKKWLH